MIQQVRRCVGIWKRTNCYKILIIRYTLEGSEKVSECGNENSSREMRPHTYQSLFSLGLSLLRTLYAVVRKKEERDTDKYRDKERLRKRAEEGWNRGRLEEREGGRERNKRISKGTTLFWMSKISSERRRSSAFFLECLSVGMVVRHARQSAKGMGSTSQTRRKNEA